MDRRRDALSRSLLAEQRLERVPGGLLLRGRFPELRDRIVALHPYEVPEVIALRIESGSEKYVDWIVQSMY